MVRATSKVAAAIGTPALARAKSGMTAKATHGWRAISSRSIGDSASRVATPASMEVAARRRIPAPVIAGRIGDHAIEDRVQTRVTHPAPRRRHQSEDHAGNGRMDPEASNASQMPPPIAK